MLNELLSQLSIQASADLPSPRPTGRGPTGPTQQARITLGLLAQHLSTNHQHAPQRTDNYRMHGVASQCILHPAPPARFARALANVWTPSAGPGQLPGVHEVQEDRQGLC